MSKTEFEVKNLEELRLFCQGLSKSVKAGDILLLKGKVGAGKTQTVKYLVEAMGGQWVSSPSFAIHQRYQTSLMPVDHIDLYRIKNDTDLESTGFWDLLEVEDALLIIEWAERLGSNVWPRFRNIIEIEIETISQNIRKISIN